MNTYIFQAPFLGKEKVYSGHLMIETKRHLPGWGDLTDAEVGLSINRLAASLKASEGAEHVHSFVLGYHIPICTSTWCRDIRARPGNTGECGSTSGRKHRREDSGKSRNWWAG